MILLYYCFGYLQQSFDIFYSVCIFIRVVVANFLIWDKGNRCDTFCFLKRLSSTKLTNMTEKRRWIAKRFPLFYIFFRKRNWSWLVFACTWLRKSRNSFDLQRLPKIQFYVIFIAFYISLPTNSMAYGTRKFETACTRALQ